MKANTVVANKKPDFVVKEHFKLIPSSSNTVKMEVQVDWGLAD